MTYDRAPLAVAATPEDVLDVLRDWHRQQCQIDAEADPDAVLTFETTIADWRSACDLLGWRGLARALDGEWRLGRPDAAWRAVLVPARQRTLRKVCEFIARGAVRPSIEPLSILGRSCLPAGAFLAIRWMLREAGVDVHDLSPSTPLDEYARHHLGVFLGPISKLAPNSLPAVEVSTSWFDWVFPLGCILGWLIVVLGFFVSPLVTGAGAVVAAIFWALAWVTPLPPGEVKFGGLKTFRDLALIIAEGSQRVQA